MTGLEHNWLGGNNITFQVPARFIESCLPALLDFCRQGQGHYACNYKFNCPDSLQHHRRFPDQSDRNHKPLTCSPRINQLVLWHDQGLKWLDASFLLCLSSTCPETDNCKHGGVPKPPGHGWTTTSGLHSLLQRPGGPADLLEVVAMRSVRFARGLRPPAALGRAEQSTEKPSPARFPPSPENGLSHPRCPMMSVWRDPEMSHARLARNTTASFPRPFSGHCPSSCAPPPPAYSCMRTTRYRPSVPGSPAVQTISHRLWENASEGIRSSDQIAVRGSCLPLHTMAVKQVFTSEEEMCSWASARQHRPTISRPADGLRRTLDDLLQPHLLNPTWLNLHAQLQQVATAGPGAA